MLTDSFRLLPNNQMFVGNMQTIQKLSWGQGLFRQQVSKAKMIYFIVSGLLAKCNWQLYAYKKDDFHFILQSPFNWNTAKAVVFLDITYEIE